MAWVRSEQETILKACCGATLYVFDGAVTAALRS